MTLEDSNHSSRDYAREANHTRRRLAESLDELNNRLTPGQIFDEVLSYTRGGGSTFLRGLSNAARENPIPSLLIGTGCMLFLSEKMGFRGLPGGLLGASQRDYSPQPRNDGRRMADGMSQGRQQSYADSARSAMQSATDYADEQASRVRAAADYAGEQISDAAEGVRQSANSAMNRAKDTFDAASDIVSDSAQMARETAHDLRDKVAEGSSRLKDTAQSMGAKARDYSQAVGDQFSAMQQQATEAGRRATDRTSAFVNEQPLLVAAIGLAVGAAVAALLPSTRTEDELMGTTSDAVKKAAGSVASEHFSQAKTAAGRVAEEAANVAEREGLTVSAAVDAAKQVSDKVKHVVTKTAEAGKSELKDLAKPATN